MEMTWWEVGECPLDRDRLKAGLTVDQESLHGGLYGGRRKTVSNEKFINIVLDTG